MDNLSKNKIKWIRSLRLKKNRIEEKRFIVEGEKMVKELIDSNASLVDAIITTEQDFHFTGTTWLTNEKTMEQLSSLNTPNKFIAIVRFPEFETLGGEITLVLDGIQDPGNMGTIIRTADWFGVDQIFCSKDTVDIYNPKVVQSSMGSIFHVPVHYTELDSFLDQTSLPIYGTLLEGENMYEIEKIKPCIIVMGNEGSGISETIRSKISYPLHIPGKGKAESLNVSIATGIVLSEFSR